VSTPTRPTHPHDLFVTSSEPASGSASSEGRRPPPPRHVLERARDGDREALGVFFDHYFDLVFGLVLRLLGDRAAAEDVTQEVFYKVQRAIGRLDPARDPAAWLTAIAYNACRDVWRSGAYRLGRRSGSIDADPVVAAKLESGGGTPESDAIAHERERAVQAAILALPEPLRAVVLMHDYQGLDHLEIAEVLGVEHAAARKRYSRALAALAKLLKEQV
jgi:RNA polymerase sigma factor (sigma-70 family)